MLRNTFTQIRPLGLALLAYGFIAALGLPATAATASELLEKAIYTEETVGDLDKAIQTYEKVVAEGKDAQNVAAQAQFRIGTCYAKLGKTEESVKAFQAVIQSLLAGDCTLRTTYVVPDKSVTSLDRHVFLCLLGAIQAIAVRFEVS